MPVLRQDHTQHQLISTKACEMHVEAILKFSWFFFFVCVAAALSPEILHYVAMRPYPAPPFSFIYLNRWWLRELHCFLPFFFQFFFFLPYLDEDIQVTNFESGRPTSLRDVRYEEACNRLAVEAVKRGCTDNVTVMIVDISQPSSTKDSQETVTVVRESS